MAGHLRPRVLVFGGCNLDVIARADRPLRSGVSNPGMVYIGAGGAARNVAVNLARLRIPTALISAVGRDPAGDYLLAETERAGVDVRWVVRTAERSNYYVAVAAVGADVQAISDMAAAEALTPAHVALAAETIPRTELVVIDANMRARTLGAAVEAAGSTPLCLLPTSPAKAPRLAPFLERAALIVASAAELETLTGVVLSSADEALSVAGDLRTRTGADVLVSMGPLGIGIATAELTDWLPSLRVAVVDATGAGDAVAAAAVYARLQGLGPADSLQLARAAGAMTVTTPGATHPALTIDALRAYV